MSDIPNSRRSPMEHERDMPDAQTDAPLAKLLADATPGPWQVNGTRHSGDLKIGQGARLHFVGPDDDPVTAVFYDMTTGKGLADARLIALAPTLAAEVIALRKQVEAADAMADSCETYFESACDMTFVLEKLKAYRDTDAKP